VPTRFVNFPEFSWILDNFSWVTAQKRTKWLNNCGVLHIKWKCVFIVTRVASPFARCKFFVTEISWWTYFSVSTPTGQPKWLRIIGIRGNCLANSVTSGIWWLQTNASKLKSWRSSYWNKNNNLIWYKSQDFCLICFKVSSQPNLSNDFLDYNFSLSIELEMRGN